MLAIIMVVTMVLTAVATMVIFFALGEREPRPVAVIPSQLQTLEARLTAQSDLINGLQNRLTQVEQAPTIQTAPAAPSINVDAVTADVSVLKAELAALREELASLKSQVSATQGGAEQKLLLTLYLSRLRQVAEQGGDFVHELQQVRDTAGANSQLVEAMQPLDAYAQKGIVPHDQLLQQFRSLATMWDRQLQDTGTQSWQDRLMAAAKNLVSVRRVDQYATTPALNDLGQALAQRRYDTAWELAGQLSDRLPISELRDQIQARATLVRSLTAAEQQMFNQPLAKPEGQP
ncbi:MAG: hypothetical protein EBV03_10590 [Proteobacteria bacterium]|nr:hypothetical protein [Pseudomonadota bacterium]